MIEGSSWLSLFEQKRTTYEDVLAAALLLHHDPLPSPGHHLQPLVFAQPRRESLAHDFPVLERSFAGRPSLGGVQYPGFPAAGIMGRFQASHAYGEPGWPVDQSGFESCSVPLLLRVLLVASSDLS